MAVMVGHGEGDDEGDEFYGDGEVMLLVSVRFSGFDGIGVTFDSRS